ncbi:MAG TPA: DUF3617 family protein [Aliidongia sp.]|uniref:DUF3617 domain-containing protein n=1 Tax=Aliidongia sp. TaxID=1914230 RepID=UPI002DDD77AB|nr:DUF3617 family protein [Aliidongia sp.]HEV2677057.1 DUF3617 family protein [Aliidongia sp.]
MNKRSMMFGVAIALALAAPARAADVPVDTGLWEMQMTMSMGGIQIPAETLEKLKKMGVSPPGQPTTTTSQSCVTQQTLDKFGAMPNQNGRCHQENLQRTDRSMSFDMVCDSPQNNAKGHVTVQFDDRTHVHGTVKMAGTHTDGSGKTMPFSVDATQSGHWLSRECGAVQPMQ